MAVYSVTKLGFIEINQLLDDLDKELTKEQPNGKTYFVRKFPVSSTGIATATSQKLIYEVTPDIDPLADYQVNGSITKSGWRICFNQIDADRLAVHIGTEIQLPDSGNLAYLNRREPPPLPGGSYTGVHPKPVEPPGTLSQTWTPFTETGAQNPTYGTPNPEIIAETWVNRIMNKDSTDSKYKRAYPMSYMLSMTNRGMYLGIWEDSQEEIPQWTNPLLDNTDRDANEGYGNSPFRWFVVQRSVDRVTGHIRGGGRMRGDNDPGLETSRCPVYCVGGTTKPHQFFKFIVRENDVISPSRKKYASVNTVDSPAVLNPWPQNSITESGEYVVTFINNLSTPRFRYSDELDMIGTVGADVVGGGSQIKVFVYGETKPRTYTAAYATKEYGTGMRIMVLTDGHDDVEDDHNYFPGGVQTANIVANVSTVNEGGTVRFTVTTTNIPNFGRIYWRNIGTTTDLDFVDNLNSGYAIVNSNQAIIDRQIKNDVTTDGSETLQLEIRRVANTVAPLMTLSPSVNVVDTSKLATYSVYASTDVAFEGSNVKFTIETTDVTNGTFLYWNIQSGAGLVGQSDIQYGLVSGTAEIQSQRGEVIVNLIEDFFTEGAETLTFNVRKIPGTTAPVVATTTLSVSDTSLTPVYTFIPNVTVAIEGDTIQWTITATNTPNGTQLYYNNIGTTTTSDFTTADGGSVTITSGTATVILTLDTDLVADPGETIRLALRTGSVTGPIKVLSPVVNVTN